MSLILTVGHSNHSIERFIEILKWAGTSVLVDVRTNPYSRAPHFNKLPLAEKLHYADIKYKSGGQYLGGKNNVSITDDNFIAKMNAIIQLADEGLKPMMMCSEKDPCECHRAMKLSAWLLRNKPHVIVGHIIPNKDGTLSIIDSKELEQKQKPTWGWHEMFPLGTYGKVTPPK